MTTILTDTARARLTQALNNVQLTKPTYIGWGTGTTDADPADVGLETPAAEARVNGTATVVTTAVTGDTFKVDGALTVAGAPKTITEAALFDASTSGNCYVRGVFSGIALEIGESIAFTVTIQQA